jgi:hypothetical protein
MLQNHRRSVRDVASRLGYASAEQLAQHFVEVTGCTPSQARTQLSSPKIVELATAAVFKKDTRQHHSDLQETA